VNIPLILQLVQLRYKLLWAKTRSRNGRIALFLTGYLLVAVLIAFLVAGGVGAGILAVRSGRTQQVAQAVLTAIFFQAILSTNILGFGMSAVFSETELRRYPLTAADRRLARHLTSILDPFWFLFLALELGLAIGLYVLNAANFWVAILAVLLFFLCNYLAARLVAVIIDQLVKRKGGTAILLAMVMGLAILPGALAPLLNKNPHVFEQVMAGLRPAPPFAAARLLLGNFEAFPILLAWIAGLGAVVLYLENRPPQRQSAASVKVTWDGPLDRIGALYGPRLGPFVSHWLRFYVRNGRTRTMTMLALPLAGFLTYTTGIQIKPNGFFVAALGTIAIATFLGTSRIAVNQFGYSGGAFRRYFLLPTDPGDTLRAASLAAVTVGAAVLPVVLILWIALVPHSFDIRMVVMLLGAGITGLFLFNAVGIWITLFNPRKGNYNSNFGNDLSLGGNVVLVGGMLVALLLPRLLARIYPAAVSPANWWLFLPLPVIAVTIYLVSLKLAAPLFNTRREILLAVIEGKN
jgi:hypothetical protein